MANHLGLKFRTVAIPSIVNDDPEDAHHTRPAYDAAAAAVANPDADTGASMTTVGEFHATQGIFDVVVENRWINWTCSSNRAAPVTNRHVNDRPRVGGLTRSVRGYLGLLLTRARP